MNLIVIILRQQSSAKPTILSVILLCEFFVHLSTETREHIYHFHCNYCYYYSEIIIILTTYYYTYFTFMHLNERVTPWIRNINIGGRRLN